MACFTGWQAATRLTGDACADWRPGEDPEAVGVEVLFVAEPATPTSCAPNPAVNSPAYSRNADGRKSFVL